MKYALRVSAPDGVNDIDAVVIRLYPEYIDYLVALHEEWVRIKATFEDLSEIRLWDTSATFCEIDQDENGEFDFTALYDGVPVKIPEPAEKFKYYTANTELDELVINDDSVYWTACVKHTDLVVSTCRIKIEDLKKLKEDST